jgi:hypothetical protein
MPLSPAAVGPAQRTGPARYRADPQASAWVGKAVADVMGLSAFSDDKADRAKIGRLLCVWTENGALLKVQDKHEKRNVRTFVEVGHWAEPAPASPRKSEVGQLAKPTTSRRSSIMVNRKKGAASEPIQEAPKPRPTPGPRNKAAIAAAIEADRARPVRTFIHWSQTEDGKPMAQSPHSDDAGHVMQLLDVFGTRSSSFMSQALGTLEWTTRRRGEKAGESDLEINASMAIVQAIDPDNELEAALAIQMAGCHALTCEMLGRAKQADDLTRLERYGNLAIKLQRTFTTQIEALARMRGKGQQTVRVEHVTVQPGGQAIVGDVHRHPRGAGASEKAEDQPHGTGQPAECASLPSPDPLGNGVSFPGNAERPMQAARRPVARRASRKSERAEARMVER